MLKISVGLEKRKAQRSLGEWAPGFRAIRTSRPKVVVKRKKNVDKDHPKLVFQQQQSLSSTTSSFSVPKITSYVIAVDQGENAMFPFDDEEDEGEEEEDDVVLGSDDRSLLAKSDSCGAMMIDYDDQTASLFLPPQGVFMSDYYRVAFPVDTIVTLATAGGSKSLAYSEIAMVIDGTWWRNKTFENNHSFKNFMVDKSPSRIEIGPIHSTLSRKGESKLDYLKHLVFDIDVDDEHYIRWCECKGYKMTCAKCWLLTTIGIKIVVHLLRRAFGFEHILEIYSGRRGAHIWVIDTKTLQYTRSVRASVVEFIDKHRDPSAFSTRDGDILYAEVIEPAFDEIYVDGDVLTDMDVSRYVLLRVPTQEARDKISDGWWSAATGTEMWDVVESVLSADDLVSYKRQIAFGLLWVHLDTAVTVNLDHLVKAPFVIHPGTGHICTPIPYHDWTPKEALTKEMVMVKPGLLKPYVDHVNAILEKAYKK